MQNQQEAEMRKIGKRVLAAVLAATLLFPVPGMASYVRAETVETEHTSESVTVQECTHVYTEQSYSHVNGSLTHTQTCADCGAVEEVDCEYTEFGETYNIKVCACGATLTAYLTGADNLVYNGERQKPGATFMVDGVTPRDVANVKTYTYNKDAGTGTLAIIDVDGVFWGMLLLEFTIAKATPMVTWDDGSEQTLTYTGQEAAVTASVQLVNNEAGTVSYSYAQQGSDSYISGLPTDVGTYSVKAGFAEQTNYVAAEAEQTLTITPLSITVTPDSGQYKEYGVEDPELTYTITPGLIGDDKLSGALTYENNEAGAIGKYEIIQGTLAASSNYEMMFTSGVMFEITRRSLEKAIVTVNGDFTYDGTPQTPTADQVKVVLNGVEIPSSQYTISASGNIDAGTTATVTATATEDSDYIGSASGKFTIAKAPLTITASDQTITYGRSITMGIGSVTSAGLCNSDKLSSVTLTPSTTNVPGGTITLSAASITNGSDQDVTGNYAITYMDGQLTISYMEPPKDILYNKAAKERYYGRAANGVAISAAGYTVCDVQNGEYQDSFTIPVPDQTGTVTKTLYFSKDGGISDGVEITVDFDLTPPAGKITVGTKWWETLLDAITFGHYAAKEYTVTIESNDADGSGAGEIQYAIVEGDTQYTDAGELAKATGITWTEYDNKDKPKVPADRKCVIYARLTDNVGNVAYISTEGILLDGTPPTVDDLSVPESTVGTETAEFAFTVDEAADYYYVVLPESVGAPEAEDIISGGTVITGSAASGNGEVKVEQVAGEKATVNLTVSNLTPGMKYIAYVTAVDRAVDLETGASAGNVGDVKFAGFTMKKLDQATPALSYQADRTDESNVKITINPVNGAEYSFDGGTTWRDENEKDGFNISQTVTIAIRLKETDTHNPSPARTVTVNLAKKDREAPPQFTLRYEANGETDYTVTIPPTEGCEYSFDGEAWSEDNAKTGVKVGETVTGYKRYKESDEYNTGSAVSDFMQMPKFTVMTPVITPAGGSYAGSVSVTITCGSPDAEIYYTTDGSMPTSSSTRYAGAFTVTLPATVKAIAIKEGLTDSAVATASYTMQSSSGSEGAGSLGGGNSGEGGSGTVRVTSPQTGQPWSPWWFVVIGILMIVTGTGVCFRRAGVFTGKTV